MNWNDVAERLVWTVLSAALATGAVYLADAPYGWVPVATAVVNWALLWVRTRAGLLPDPGKGLPGLPTAAR